MDTTTQTSALYAAFEGGRKIADGALLDVALKVKARGDAATSGAIQIFDATGRSIDLDLRGATADIEARYQPEQPSAPRGPGRPKLGVVAREVTLLPRHWDWLNAQPGGASVALRKLVESARSGNTEADRKREARDNAYRFMSAIAGDQTGFEDSIRALYAGHRAQFETHTGTWPRDVRDHAAKLAEGAFAAQ